MIMWRAVPINQPRKFTCRRAPGLDRFQQTAKHLAGDILRQRIVVQAIADIAEYLREVLVVDSGNRLGIQITQGILLRMRIDHGEVYWENIR